MKIAALLTAKGQNTLPDKNVLQIKGHPLLYYPATAARRATRVERFYCSSDSQRILNLAEELGYTRIERPSELARPESKHVDAILHALDVMQRLDGYVPDILVVLLGNNISIKTEWIDESIRQMEANPGTSAVVPVYEDQDHHPFRAKQLGTDGFLTPFFDFGGRPVSTNRQELPRSFFLCHNFWTLNVALSVSATGGQPPWSFMGSSVRPIIVDESIDVHYERDLFLCERWVEKHGINYD